ncbi:MAG: type I secretion C-terminal target domain-containing protein, partial [Desulfovibrio sp.]|jgi:hypothetical protein|nr:type I secretion C-terminal target domain-containing protein [Desulfovibrio sp.]
VDTPEAQLSLWVQDPADAGKLVRITAGPGEEQEIGYDHGTLFIKADGSFRYEDNPATPDADRNIRVVVSDGNSATESVITVDHGTSGGQAQLGQDYFRMYGVDQSLVNSDRIENLSPNLLDNDTGTTGEILNAGTYYLDNYVIAAEGAAGYAGALLGSGLEICPDASLKGEFSDRFEVRLNNISVTLQSNGKASIDGSSHMNVYDRETGAYYYFRGGTAHRVLEKFLGDTGMTFEEAREALQVHFTYQAAAADGGGLLEGDLVLDYLSPYSDNSGMGFPSSSSTSNRTSNIGISSTFDHVTEQQGDTGLLNASSCSTAQLQVSDSNADDVSIRFGGYDAAGNSVPGAAGQEWHKLRDMMESADPADRIIHGIPVYAWINATTGEVAVAKGAGAGWECVQVGEVTFTQTLSQGANSMGINPDGTPMTYQPYSQIQGTFDVRFFTAEGSDALRAFMEAMKNLGEAEARNMLFFFAQARDEPGSGITAVSSSGTSYISITGSDVLLASSAAELQEEDVLGMSVSGLLTGLGSNASHTFGGNRHTADGWDVQDTDPSDHVADSGFTLLMDGQYGYLAWDEGQGDYVYHLYQAGDVRGGVTLSQADVDSLRAELTGLVAGQSKTEQFAVTMADKNGEKTTGTVQVAIRGQDTDYSDLENWTPPPGFVTDAVEHGVFANDLAPIFHVDDAYDDLTYRLAVNGANYPTAAQSGMEKILISVVQDGVGYGDIVFFPKTGQYYFQSNGKLTNGQTLDIDMQAWVEVKNSHSSGVIPGTSTPGYASPQIDVDLTVTGVNDAPIVITVASVLEAGGSKIGGVTWMDADNALSDSVTVAFTHGTNSAQNISDGSYDRQIQGEHGALKWDTGTGAWDYALDANLGGSHRVIDSFGVSVTDDGHLGGDNATGASRLVVYGVDGESKTGADGDDTLTGVVGKANIFIGGKGNDVIDLTGTAHENILVWQAGDQGSSGSPASDRILNFNKDSDALDLRDMLAGLGGESGKTASDLVSFRVEGGHTIISIADADGNVVQEIILDSVALTGNGTYEDLLGQTLLISDSGQGFPGVQGLSMFMAEMSEQGFAPLATRADVGGLHDLPAPAADNGEADGFGHSVLEDLGPGEADGFGHAGLEDFELEDLESLTPLFGALDEVVADGPSYGAEALPEPGALYGEGGKPVIFTADALEQLIDLTGEEASVVVWEQGASGDVVTIRGFGLDDALDLRSIADPEHNISWMVENNDLRIDVTDQNGAQQSIVLENAAGFAGDISGNLDDLIAMHVQILTTAGA